MIMDKITFSTRVEFDYEIWDPYEKRTENNTSLVLSLVINEAMIWFENVGILEGNVYHEKLLNTFYEKCTENRTSLVFG